MVQIPRVPQAILKKWKEITCESQRAFLLAEKKLACNLKNAECSRRKSEVTEFLSRF